MNPSIGGSSSCYHKRRALTYQTYTEHGYRENYVDHKQGNVPAGKIVRHNGVVERELILRGRMYSEIQGMGSERKIGGGEQGIGGGLEARTHRATIDGHIVGAVGAPEQIYGGTCHHVSIKSRGSTLGRRNVP